MATSIKDIARELHLSPSTVSRALNNIGGISEKTAHRVREIAEKMDYVPNNVARNLKGACTKSIGVIIPDITEMFFAKIVRGIDHALSVKGYNILLCDSNESETKEKDYVRLLLQNRVDGIIIATVRQTLTEDDLLFGSKLPLIYVDNLPDSYQKFNVIALDNIRASVLVVKHLVENGHSRIAAIMGKQNETTGHDRFVGFKEGMDQCGILLDPALVRFGDFKEQSGYDAMMDLVKSGEKFTAVYCTSSKMTYGALQALRDLNMKIPQDMSIVGFDVSDDYNMISPGITTIIQPEERIGTLAANTLLRMIKNHDGDVCQHLSLEPTLLVRESVENICASQTK